MKKLHACFAVLAGALDAGLFAIGCDGDEGGGGFEKRDQMNVAEGTYTASIDNLQLSFMVPQTMRFGGICVGSLF